MRKIVLLGLLGLLAALSQGCLSAGIYRTARTLEPGRGDFGLTWNTTRVQSGSYTTIDENGNEVTQPGTSLTLPNIIPELAYHIGVVDNLELGGRLAPLTGFIEIDAKFRFFRSPNDQLHMALQPAIGYSSLFFIEGLNATLPLILTFDATKNVSLNIAPYVAYQSYNQLADDIIVVLSGDYVTTGASLGVQLRGRKFYVQPNLDVARSVANFSQSTADFVTYPTQTYVRFGITLGWISGQELESLDRIEDKLDRVLDEKEKEDGDAGPPDKKDPDDGEEDPDDANEDPDDPDDPGPSW